MKKIFVLIAACLMTTAFVGCGNKAAGDTTAQDSTVVDSIESVDTIEFVDTAAVADSIVADSNICEE